MVIGASAGGSAFVKGPAVTSSTILKRSMVAKYKLDDPAGVTCPDCGGASPRTELGTLAQFGCHIGHTDEVMVATQFAAMEVSLGAAMRSPRERGELCRQMADKARFAGNGEVAAR